MYASDQTEHGWFAMSGMTTAVTTLNNEPCEYLLQSNEDAVDTADSGQQICIVTFSRINLPYLWTEFLQLWTDNEKTW